MQLLHKQLDLLQLGPFLLKGVIVILILHGLLLKDQLVERFDLHPMEEVEYFGLLFRLRVLCIRLTYDFLRGSFYSYS